MLDEYGVQLLAEMGIEVYLPRAAHAGAAGGDAPAAGGPSSPPAVAATAPMAPVRATGAGILILGHEAAPPRLLADLVRALRLLDLDAAPGAFQTEASIAAARGLIVLGEALARQLGAGMPAQRQNEIAWIVTAGPAALAGNAAAKQALWGEIKRLARSSRANRARD